LALGACDVRSKFSQGKPVYTKPIGLQAYTFRGSWDKGIEATLDTIKSLGVTEMEGGPIKGMATEELRKQLDKRGIKMVSDRCRLQTG
jgi:sugar phosphate isomerase/epimerase